jgi:biofilm PGA synthesis N-glycosyltransferase PgaC
MSQLVYCPRYVIITPVRNEELHLRHTIESVTQQTIQPVEWVIVNDGSTDQTGAMIDEWAGRFPWIHTIHRSNRGFRKSGGGVVEAFYGGYNSLNCEDWDFIVKLDGDLSFSRDYFERCLEQFKASPELGIGGGSLYHIIDGEKQFEAGPHFHVRGATKIYRRECWQAIGSLWPAAGWDTIDEVKANMLGWTTQTFASIEVIHHRFTGTEDGKWRDSVKHGLACYTSRYHPLFVLASCIYRLGQKPYVTRAAGTFWGFLRGYLRDVPRVADGRYATYIQQQQLSRLFGKETIWK